jgi:hypothetical protein
MFICGLPKRGWGRPRASWTEETIKSLWKIVRRNSENFRYQQFDEDSEEMIKAIKEYEEK